MTNEETEKYRKRLVEIQKKSDGQFQALQNLAREVGASIINRYKGHGDAGQAELTDNIHQALQTATMIDMCKTSTSMCEIAAKNYKIASKAANIALGSAVAAWAAVLTMILIAAFVK